ncbi:MAG: IS4 family transposase [Rhodobacter sp.]|nr:IS4 family transposase [Rhodobacter sp.]
MQASRRKKGRFPGKNRSTAEFCKRHMGFRSPVIRSTLAKANGKRDWRIYADFAQSLIRTARRPCADDMFQVEPDNTVYALDSTTVDLCLSVFPWAHFRRTKAAVKMHTLLDLRGNIPTFIDISAGKLHDVNVLDRLLPEAGAFYIMDRAYLDFERLHHIHLHGGYFVLRAKRNTQLRRLYSRPADRDAGVVCDQVARPAGKRSSIEYPDRLRRIRYHDRDRGKTFVFLTNNFVLPPLTIAELYRARWQVELFFRWIKQHLRIKSFLGTSANAVKTQIWIAITVYVLVAIIRKRLNCERSLYTILQILDVTLFEKIELNQLLNEPQCRFQPDAPSNQLNLFDF